MEGTMSEIRIFAADFAPRTWAFCQGQTLPVTQNQALFALLGTIYGGNGTQTFQLPDFRGRVPVGTGTNSPSGAITLGQIAGEQTHTLILAEMPLHTHTATGVTGTLTAPKAQFTLNASSNDPSDTDPTNGLFANENNFGLAVYADPNSSVVPMAGNALTATFTASGNPTATLQTTGSSTPHSNMQPYIAMNYIICLRGIFPSRN